MILVKVHSFIVCSKSSNSLCTVYGESSRAQCVYSVCNTSKGLRCVPLTVYLVKAKCLYVCSILKPILRVGPFQMCGLKSLKYLSLYIYSSVYFLYILN